jgi:1-acyl-sn-glycerol-3-phosphate acyltransferase
VTPRLLLQRVLEALFRVLFVYRCEGEEHVPAQGRALVVANHPSYLDPLLLSLQVVRPIRFMAWDALFNVPVLGPLMRTFGAFPVDVRRGQGKDAYEKARALLDQGEVVGLFPEGKRSRTGWMEPALRAGAARLALAARAPVVPATITGAFRAWPHYQALPRPGRVRVRFHPPIDPAPFAALPEEDGVAALLGEIRRRVEGSLMPGVKADLKMDVLYRLPSPWPRMYEVLTALGAASVVFWRTRSLTAVAPAYLYLAYLFADHLFLPQQRIIKWLRNASPVLFALTYGEVVLAALGAPQVPAAGALLATCLGGFFAYLYERTWVALSAVRGFVIAAALEAAALWRAPDALGPHVALPLFLAVYAWERRSVFWRWSAPVLLAYAVAVPFFLAGRLPGPVHALPALLAWLIERVFPYDLPSRDGEAPAAPAGLGLRM